MTVVSGFGITSVLWADAHSQRPPARWTTNVKIDTRGPAGVAPPDSSPDRVIRVWTTATSGDSSLTFVSPGDRVDLLKTRASRSACACRMDSRLCQHRPV